MTKNSLCPCGTGLPYAACCQLYHLGKKPERVEQLMRSRYSAYALNLPQYIIETTHPHNPAYQKDKQAWIKEIEAFSMQTAFKRLDVLAEQENGNEGIVCFVAYLQRENQDLTFTEKSFFKKEQDRWLYKSGYTAGGVLSKEQAQQLR